MTFLSYSFAMVLLGSMLSRVTVGRANTSHLHFAILTAASCLFYAWGFPPHLLLLLGTTALDYYAGNLIPLTPLGSVRRSLILGVSIAANLGVLAFFKYAPLAGVSVLLPIGISFFTFQSMSYTIDIYRGRLEPVATYGKFLLYVSFFPQLVAGPIVRASEFLPQLGRRRRLHSRVLAEGAYQIVRGLFLKLVCADNLAYRVDTHWNLHYDYGTSEWVLLGNVVLFSFQIFCDFEGYSGIARGLSYLMGLRLPVNFDNPFLAGSFKNFWERWHITLSRWLRDYLYVPLGGNRQGKARTSLNLFLVMLIGGAWHGGNATFVVWGALHGAALVLERRLGFHDLRAAGWLRRLTWFLFVQSTVLVGWVFFRSTSIAEAKQFFSRLFFSTHSVIPDGYAIGFLFLAPAAAMHARGWLAEKGLWRRGGPREKAMWAAFMLLAILSCYGKSDAFLYFKF